VVEERERVQVDGVRREVGEQAQVEDWLEEQVVEREAGARVVLAEECGRLAAGLRLRVAVVCWRAGVRWQERKEAGQAAAGNEGGAMLRVERRQDRGKMSEERAQETRIERLRLRRLS
jgi:hypothetical protein